MPEALLFALFAPLLPRLDAAAEDTVEAPGRSVLAAELFVGIGGTLGGDVGATIDGSGPLPPPAAASL